MGKSKSGVYRIINITNNKMYVGGSVNIRKRINVHFNDLKKGKHCNKHLQKSYNKYGRENFKWEILDIIEFNSNRLLLKESILEKEQYWIDKLIIKNGKNIGYNICLKSNSCLGIKLSDEHKKKISLALMGEKNPCYGKIYTDEEKRKISLALMGEKNPMYGKIYTDEEKEKQKYYRLGTKHSEKTKRKISESNIGKHNGKRTLETRRKISEAGKNRFVSEETRKKQSISMTGLKRTKKEIVQRIINCLRRKELIIKKDGIEIYCFSASHAANILNVHKNSINRSRCNNTTCKGYNIYVSEKNYYKKEILLKNMDLFNDKYYPTKKLIKILTKEYEKK